MILSIYKNFWSVLKMVYINIIFFSWDRLRFFSSDKAFKDQIFVSEGLKKKWQFSSFLNSLGVRKDLLVIEYPHPMCFSAGGQWRFSEKSHAGIFMSHGLFELDPQAYSFIFKHEVSHILGNDVFLKSVVAVIGASCLAVASLQLGTGFFFNSFLQFCVMFLGFLPFSFLFLGSLWMRLAEFRADRFACKHSSVEELQGAIRYFTAVKAYNAELSSRFPNLFKPNGELVKGLHVPTTQSRIAYFHKQILRQGAAFYTPSQSEVLSHIELLKKNDQIQAQVMASLQGL